MSSELGGLSSLGSLSFNKGADVTKRGKMIGKLHAERRMEELARGKRKDRVERVREIEMEGSSILEGESIKLMRTDLIRKVCQMVGTGEVVEPIIKFRWCLESRLEFANERHEFFVAIPGPEQALVYGIATTI